MSDLIATFKEYKPGEPSLWLTSGRSHVNTVAIFGAVACFSFIAWINVLAGQKVAVKDRQEQLSVNVVNARFGATQGAVEKHRLNTAMPQVNNCIEGAIAKYDIGTPDRRIRADTTSCIDLFMGPAAN